MRTELGTTVARYRPWMQTIMPWREASRLDLPSGHMLQQ